MGVLFTVNYFLVRGDVPVDSEVLLVIDFMNLKIKPTQSFRCAHRGRVCVRVFIGVSDRTCMNIRVCTVFLKKYRSINQKTNKNHFAAVTSRLKKRWPI
jgi:hypothetical protein